MTVAVQVEELTKSFGRICALDRVSLSVPPGTTMGLLGPNSAGKTTLVRILTTLIPPDGGRAEVMGHDVVTGAAALRSTIGLAGQFAAVDEILTGRENLELVGRLYHLSRSESRARAEQLLRQFELDGSADRPVKTLSGGMRRRLDLAGSLVMRPPVLILDEPTTGLDPRGRIGLWEVIRELVRDGTTLLLTTQYLEEADRLADAIAVIDQGRIIAEGTAAELKTRVGGDVLEVTLVDPGKLAGAAAALAPAAAGEPVIDSLDARVTVPVAGGPTVMIGAVRRLDAAGIGVRDLVLRRPTLDDVFLALTGHGTDAGATSDSNGRGP